MLFTLTEQQNLRKKYHKIISSLDNAFKFYLTILYLNSCNSRFPKQVKKKNYDWMCAQRLSGYRRIKWNRRIRIPAKAVAFTFAPPPTKGTFSWGVWQKEKNLSSRALGGSQLRRKMTFRNRLVMWIASPPLKTELLQRPQQRSEAVLLYSGGSTA